jgi:hypothetical protein
MKTEIRYQVVQDFSGKFQMESMTATIRGKTVKLHECGLDWEDCSTIVSLEKWNQWPRDKQEAIRQKFKELNDQRKSRMEEYRKINSLIRQLEDQICYNALKGAE